MNRSSAPPPNHFPFPYPPPPNPNPSPNIFFHPLHRPPPPPQQHPPPPPLYQLPPPPPQQQYSQFAAAPPVLDVSSALSSLTELISLSRRTLSSLSSLIDSEPEKVNETHVPCPYNHHHLMPPESLFLHTLRCPSPVCEDPTSLIQSLHYPKTLDLRFQAKTRFDESSEKGKNGELSLSLDSYFKEFKSNFFYRDCPGAVNFIELENSGKVVTLPGVLSAECADSVGVRERRPCDFDKNRFRILSSELWAITREVDGWVDYPAQYSYGVLCGVLRLNVVERNCLGRWIIANSPRFGCVIDAYMRDHISLLVGLCLKAIRREALVLVDCDSNVVNLSFPCPVSVQALKWLASQLSVLYGEVNAKCFTIYIFKQCILEAAKEALLFCLSPGSKESSKDLDENKTGTKNYKAEGTTFEECREHEEDKKDEGNAETDGVVVYQVEAAVAALQERSLLEAKIKALRNSQLPPSYQRAVQHTYLTTRADEERKKHPDYRPTIEHDGFRKRSTNQETNRPKTKEELLAEERDYKRRRMSYRGKKLKRTTLQVMRDIIDECMEEIKQSGGIGCYDKGAEEECVPAETHNLEVSTNVGGHTQINGESSKPITVTTDHHQKQPYSRHDNRSTTSEDALYKDNERQEQDHHYSRMEPRNNEGYRRHVREHYTKSPDRKRNHSQAHESDSRRTERNAVELTGGKHHLKSSSSNSRNNKSSSYDVSDSGHSPHVHKKHKVSDKRDRHHSRSSYSRRSSSREAQGFEDRYDPTKSLDS
ncbi:U11/U12 small nuclear ribonucleoprotein 48 kDa protein [Linum perenne]